jgi:hypothetical protein
VNAQYMDRHPLSESEGGSRIGIVQLLVFLELHGFLEFRDTLGFLEFRDILGFLGFLGTREFFGFC